MYTFKAGQIDLTSHWVCSWHERGGRAWSSMQNAIKDHTRLVSLFPPHLDQGEAIYIGTDNWQFIQHPNPHEPPTHPHTNTHTLDSSDGVPTHPNFEVSSIQSFIKTEPVHTKSYHVYHLSDILFGGLVLKSCEKYQLHVWRTRFLWWASSLLWSPLSQLQLLDRL